MKWRRPKGFRFPNGIPRVAADQFDIFPDEEEWTGVVDVVLPPNGGTVRIFATDGTLLWSGVVVVGG